MFRSASLLLAPVNDLDGSVRRKYGDPSEVQAHRREAVAGPTPSQDRFLRELLKPGSTVLDVGCAAGRISFAACRQGHKVLAIDSSEAMIRQAAELSRTKGFDVRFSVMDARGLGFPEASFDAVLMCGSTLSYIPRRQGRLRALGETWRVLKPGGQVLIETQSRQSAVRYRVFFWMMAGARASLERLGRRPAWEVGDRLGIMVSAARSERPVYFHMYAPDELARDLQAAGFEAAPVDTSLYLMYYVGLKL